jgi:hypothetical protein
MSGTGEFAIVARYQVRAGHGDEVERRVRLLPGGAGGTRSGLSRAGLGVAVRPA